MQVLIYELVMFKKIYFEMLLRCQGNVLLSTYEFSNFRFDVLVTPPPFFFTLMYIVMGSYMFYSISLEWKMMEVYNAV